LAYDWLVGIALLKANDIKLMKYTFTLTDCTLFAINMYVVVKYRRGMCCVYAVVWSD
jgi:hypothetical protein